MKRVCLGTFVFVAAVSVAFGGDPDVTRGLVGNMADAEELPAEGWVKVAEGVFETTDEKGGLLRRIVGEAGHLWNVQRLEELLMTIPFDARLSEEERQEKINFVGKLLLEQNRVLVAQVPNAGLKASCTPSYVRVSAHNQPFGCNCIGVQSVVHFEGANCPTMKGGGYTYAYCRSDRGTYTDFDNASRDPSFLIGALAMDAWDGSDFCQFAIATLSWADDYQNTGYQTDVIEYPAGCFQ